MVGLDFYCDFAYSRETIEVYVCHSSSKMLLLLSSLHGIAMNLPKTVPYSSENNKTAGNHEHLISHRNVTLNKITLLLLKENLYLYSLNLLHLVIIVHGIKIKDIMKLKVRCLKYFVLHQFVATAYTSFCLVYST